jgi:hypothetical protein
MDGLVKEQHREIYLLQLVGSVRSVVNRCLTKYVICTDKNCHLMKRNWNKMINEPLARMKIGMVQDVFLYEN